MRIIRCLMVVSIVAFGDVGFAQVVPGPNVSIVASDPFNQKQLEVEASANPLNPNHILAGYIDYQTVVETSRVTSKGHCGYSFSVNGGKTWENDYIPMPANADKCGDPAVAWDTNGHAFFMGLIEFTDGTTTMSVWRFTDPDDGSGRLVLDRRVQLGASNGTTSLDKGSLMFQADTSTSPTAPGALYACYTIFNDTSHTNSRIVCAISRDGGLTYRFNMEYYSRNVVINNGTATAPGPNGSVYLFWRSFGQGENGYYFLRVNSRGYVSSAPIRVPLGNFYPYDAPTLPDLARTNAFPAVASDGDKKILLAFQAYSDANGAMAPSSSTGVSPRILAVYSADGGERWTAPFVVDYGPHDHAHQFLPRVAYAGGLWSVAFYDARNQGCVDQDGTTGDPFECGRGRPLDPNPVIIAGVPQHFPRGRDRRFDVRVAQSVDPRNFGGSTQVTLYETRADTQEIVQRDPACAPNCPAVNLPFLSVGGGGLAAWMGDYIAFAPKVQWLRNDNPMLPAWRHSRPGDPSTTLAFWADFRDVAFPLNQNGVPDINAILNINNQLVSGWTQFTPASPPPAFGGQPNVCTNPRSRDVDVLFSEITAGGLAASVKSSRQREGIPPDFTLNVQNLSGRDLFVRMEIVDTAPAEDWSMAQTLPDPAAIPPDDNAVDVIVRNNSSVNKTIYYRWRTAGNQTPAVPVLVRVSEITAIGGTPVAGGLGTSATYNIPPAPLPLNGAAHALSLSSPTVTFGQLTQQSFTRTGQPSNQLIENQLIENQLIENQLIENQLIENQLIENQLIENSLIPDQQVIWTVTGGGALPTASTAFTNVANGQELLEAGWKFQILMYQTQLNPRVFACTQLSIPTDNVLSNIVIGQPNQLIENFQISNQLIENQLIENQLIENSPISDQVSNATFSVEAGEQVHIALRAFKPATSGLRLQLEPPTFNPSDPTQVGQAVFGQAADPVTGETVGAFFDTTAPVITPTVTGTLGNDGWYTSAVTVSWLVEDAQSGIESSIGCETVTLDADTPGTTLTCTAFNRAGLSASASVTVKIDVTAPTVVIAAPANNGTYGFGAAVAADYTCSDAASGSGVAACTGPVPSGALFSTSTLGANSFTVTAADVAGNQASVTSTYTVAPTYTFALTPLATSYEVGGVATLTWQITGPSGTPIVDLGTLVRLTAIFTPMPSTGVCAVNMAGTATELYNPVTGPLPASTYGLVATAAPYRFVWDTRAVQAQGPGCYTLVWQLNDNAGPAPAYPVMNQGLLKTAVLQLK